MRIHFVKALRIIMIILLSILVFALSLYIYLGFTNRFPSKEVYLAAILFPILISPIIFLFVLDLKCLKFNKIKSNIKHNILCIINFILLPIMFILSFLSFSMLIYGGHGCSYTEKYSDYLIIMKEEKHKSTLPIFNESEINIFKYYENQIDSHQEDFFIELKYDNYIQFNNSLNYIKSTLVNYKINQSKYDLSYIDITLSNKMNTYKIFKISNTYEIIGEYLVISYNEINMSIIISYWNFISDEVISDHNPFLFEYFNYKCDSEDIK